MSDSTKPRRRILRYVAWCGAIAAVCVVFGLSGIVFAWTRFANSLPALHGWHVDSPASEFHAADAREGYTFDDYVKQENKVFAELDTLVTKDWSGESPGRFCRYKTDSICNPATVVDRNWNKTYVLEADAPIGGALLIHGLSDSPYSLRVLGEKLHEAGYTVIGLRVPGHGTCPKALAEATWPDWVAAVRVAMTGLRNRVPAGKPLLMVGYSNGGALCVNHVTASLLAGGKGGTPQPDAVVLISPMIGINALAELTELYPTVAKLSGDKKLAWTGIEPEIDPFKYSSWPINASLQAYLLTHHLEESIGKLAAQGKMVGFPPVLTIQSAADSTVIAYRMIEVLMDRLPPGRGELILFDINRAAALIGLTDNSFEEHIRASLKRSDLPFVLTLVTNRSPDAAELVAKTLKSGQFTETDIGLTWPKGIFSLSHVALPIPPTDRVYGLGQPDAPARLPLGTLSLRGENGVLAISSSLMIRMRYNPFYDWTEQKIMTWVRERTAKP